MGYTFGCVELWCSHASFLNQGHEWLMSHDANILYTAKETDGTLGLEVAPENVPYPCTQKHVCDLHGGFQKWSGRDSMLLNLQDIGCCLRVVRRS